MTCASCGTENPERRALLHVLRRGAAPPPARPAAPRTRPGRSSASSAARRSTGAAPRRPAGAPSEPPPEERRKATILFADLSGYTAVSERLDPERIKSLVDRALRRLGDEVERYGGTIDKYIGDNVMGVFGAPSPTRTTPSARSAPALAMQAAMDEINERIAADVGASFALRVGINSGEVLAGRVGDGYTVIGDPVNVAARLQARRRARAR